VERGEERCNRRARRRLVQQKRLITRDTFRCRAQLSERELGRQVRDGTVVKVRIGRLDFYPVLFLRRDRLASRLARVTRAMSPQDDPWAAFFELVYRFESLNGKTLLQIMRRGTGYRAALRYARAVGA
jgi:hypothetical protein